MPTFTCQQCGKPFEGISGRKRMYCAGACFRACEAAEGTARRATWSDQRKCAANRVATAIRTGMLKRQPCEACGKKRVVAHHDDYSKPLDVRWLCKGCHKRHHNKFGPGIGAFAASPTHGEST